MEKLCFIFTLLVLNSCRESKTSQNHLSDVNNIVDTVDVILVSYEKPRSKMHPILDSNGVIHVPKCKTVKKLNSNQFKELEIILHSYPFNGGPICVGNPANGYFPMHCVLYKSKTTEQIYDFLELYFDNFNYRTIDWHTFDIRECEEYEALKNFFIKTGIKDGFNLKHTMSSKDSCLYKINC